MSTDADPHALAPMAGAAEYAPLPSSAGEGADLASEIQDPPLGPTSAEAGAAMNDSSDENDGEGDEGDEDADLVTAVACYECKLPGIPDRDVFQCGKYQKRRCGKFYHTACIAKLKHAKVLKDGRFECPLHVCAACHDKRNSQMVECIRCPAAYHDFCMSPCAQLVANGLICWKHQHSDLPPVKEGECFSVLPVPAVENDFRLPYELLAVYNARNNKPPPYVNIRKNVYVMKRPGAQRDEDKVDCQCGPGGCGQDCMCKALYMCCGKACGCDPATCGNQTFTKRKIPKLRCVKTEKKGWGILLGEDVRAGQFIIEYNGEIIDEGECERRLWEMKRKGSKDFYMMELSAHEMIDATVKGSLARFVNHSCGPNCTIQKWGHGSETCVGIFASEDLPAGTEITYDYQFEFFGTSHACYCGAKECTGVFGSKSQKPPPKKKRLVASGREVATQERSRKHEGALVALVDGDRLDCSCGNNVEDGEMVECEQCHCWEHLNCAGFGRPEDVPEGYKCAACDPPPPPAEGAKAGKAGKAGGGGAGGGAKGGKGASGSRKRGGRITADAVTPPAKKARAPARSRLSMDEKYARGRGMAEGGKGGRAGKAGKAGKVAPPSPAEEVKAAPPSPAEEVPMEEVEAVVKAAPPSPAEEVPMEEVEAVVKAAPPSPAEEVPMEEVKAEVDVTIVTPGGEGVEAAAGTGAEEEVEVEVEAAAGAGAVEEDKVEVEVEVEVGAGTGAGAKEPATPEVAVEEAPEAPAPAPAPALPAEEPAVAMEEPPVAPGVEGTPMEGVEGGQGEAPTLGAGAGKAEGEGEGPALPPPSVATAGA